MTEEEKKKCDEIWEEIKKNTAPTVVANAKEPYTIKAIRDRRNKTVSAKEAFRKGVGYRAILESQKKEERQARYGRILATAHLCMTEAINLFDEADAMCGGATRNKYGYAHKAKMVNKTFNEYNASLSKQISEHFFR